MFIDLQFLSEFVVAEVDFWLKLALESAYTQVVALIYAMAQEP